MAAYLKVWWTAAQTNEQKDESSISMAVDIDYVE